MPLHNSSHGVKLVLRSLKTSSTLPISADVHSLDAERTWRLHILHQRHFLEETPSPFPLPAAVHKQNTRAPIRLPCSLCHGGLVTPGGQMIHDNLLSQCMSSHLGLTLCPAVIMLLMSPYVEERAFFMVTACYWPTRTHTYTHTLFTLLLNYHHYQLLLLFFFLFKPYWYRWFHSHWFTESKFEESELFYYHYFLKYSNTTNNF